MKRSWIRRILSGLSFTTALFVFQACYGTPQDFGYDLFVEGIVKSKTSNLPVKGIKVSAYNDMQNVFTDADGHFSFYTPMADNVMIVFEDIDASNNGSFLKKDTLIKPLVDRINLNIFLSDK